MSDSGNDFVRGEDPDIAPTGGPDAEVEETDAEETDTDDPDTDDTRLTDEAAEGI